MKCYKFLRPVSFAALHAGFFALSGHSPIHAAAPNQKTALIAPSASSADPLESASFSFKDFTIKKSSLDKALLKFTRKTGVSFSKSSAIPPLKNFTSQGLNGAGQSGLFDLEGALGQLLKDTGLSFKRIDTHAVQIFMAPKSQNKPISPSETPRFDPVFIDEILVSATRRPDAAQTLPYSASVAHLDDTAPPAQFSLHDLSRLSPSLQNTHQRSGQNKLLVRGLSDGIFNGRAQSLVSLYLNGGRLNYSSPDPALKLYDIDRLELLRGPQGTLYGSGSLTGLYHVIQKKPDLEAQSFEASSDIATTEKGAESYGLGFTANLPLIKDKLGFRGAAFGRREGGYIDNSRLGLKNINETDYKGLNLGLASAAFEDWRFDLNLHYQSLSSKDSDYYNAALSPFERDNRLQEPLSADILQNSLTVTGDLGFAQLVSTSSYTHRDLVNQLDASPATERLFGILLEDTRFTTERDIQLLTNETHLISDQAGPINWQLGGFYSKRREDIISELIAPPLIIFGQPRSDGLAFLLQTNDELRELALFGEVRADLGAGWSLTLGLRWFDYKNSAESNYQPLESPTIFFGITDERHEDGFIPKALLAYELSDTLLLYGQYSRGYRLGGLNSIRLLPINDPDGSFDEDEERIILFTPDQSLLLSLGRTVPDYRSDQLDNYELGLKSSFWDGTLRLNGAAFWSRWRDIQSFQYDSNGLPDVDNVGNARIIGLELEAHYIPDGRSEYSATLSWNRSTITKTTGRFGADLGSRLPGSSPFSANFSARQDFTWFGLPFSARGAYHYVSSSRSLFQTGSRPRQADYHLADFKLSYVPDFWSLSFYIDNVFDDPSNVFAFANPFDLQLEAGSPVSEQYTPLRPRTWGLALSWSF